MAAYETVVTHLTVHSSASSTQRCTRSLGRSDVRGPCRAGSSPRVAAETSHRSRCSIPVVVREGGSGTERLYLLLLRSSGSGSGSGSSSRSRSSSSSSGRRSTLTTVLARTNLQRCKMVYQAVPVARRCSAEAPHPVDHIGWDVFLVYDAPPLKPDVVADRRPLDWDQLT